MNARKPALKILLCAPRGFCAGVVRAIDAVEQALAKYGAPVYVRHEIVHNKYVVEGLQPKGAIFVDELDEVPRRDAPVDLLRPRRAEGGAGRRRSARNLFAIDATCPLVTKVHREAEVHFKRGREIVLIGHAGHPEVVGTMGQLPTGAITLVETVGRRARVRAARSRRARLRHADDAVASTTPREIVEALKARFPAIAGPHKEDICYATTNRQEAVKRVAPRRRCA